MPSDGEFCYYFLLNVLTIHFILKICKKNEKRKKEQKMNIIQVIRGKSLTQINT